MTDWNRHKQPEKKSTNSFLLENQFQLSTKDLYKILNIALSKGGRFAEIYLEHSKFKLIRMEEDIIKETDESVQLGLGIRVISEDKTGYSYTNDLSLSKIKEAALTAASITSSFFNNSLPLKKQSFSHNHYRVIQPSHSSELKTKLSLVEKVYRGAQKTSPLIKKITITFSDSIQNVTIVNSDGLLISDSRPMVKITCRSLAEKEKRRESGYFGGGGRVGLEYFEQVLRAEEIGKRASQEAVELLEAAFSPSGEMPIVLSPGDSGVLIHEAVGHLLEADFIRKKTSVFWDKIGKKIADSQVTIYDDPTLSGFRGSYNIDDEGTIPKKTLLIEKGILRSFLFDKLSALILGKELTGNGRREDFSCAPLPRMSNTYLDKGEYSPEEIIKSVKKGIYAHRYQGGQVEDSGKFTFTLSSGYLIEEGRLTRPIKQATLIGTNLDILNKIEMVGSDLSFSPQTGTCSKEGQDVPISDGCPTIKISRMTVGGG